MEAGAEHGFLGRDVEGHDVDPLCEPSQHSKTSNLGTIYIGCHPGLPDWWKKGHEAIKGGESGLTNRRVVKEDHPGVCARLFERLN